MPLSSEPPSGPLNAFLRSYYYCPFIFGITNSIFFILLIAILPVSWLLFIPPAVPWGWGSWPLFFIFTQCHSFFQSHQLNNLTSGNEEPSHETGSVSSLPCLPELDPMSFFLTLFLYWVSDQVERYFSLWRFQTHFLFFSFFFYSHGHDYVTGPP